MSTAISNLNTRRTAPTTEAQRQFNRFQFTSRWFISIYTIHGADPSTATFICNDPTVQYHAHAKEELISIPGLRLKNK